MNHLSRQGLVALALAGLVAMPGCGLMSDIRNWTYRKEVRAMQPTGTGYTQQVTLTGANEVPPVATSATGNGSVTVASTRAVTARITVTGMNATAAHIHMAAAGAEGPVIVPLTKTGDNAFAAAEGAKLTEEQYEAF